MKTIHSILLFIFLISLQGIQAQDGRPCPKIEEMHAMKFRFLTDKARLTPKEAELIQPIFMEYEKALWEQHKQNHEFFKTAMNPGSGEKPNYAELNDRYAEQELKQSQLFKAYHLKLRRLISAETLFRYYKAEREYKRHLMMEVREKPPRPGKPMQP